MNHSIFVPILLGPPGSGKGTQAKKLSTEFHLPHISTGDLFREHIANDTPLGKKVKEYLNAGKLGPDELVLDMLFERVSKPDCSKGFLLDGFPRTLNQAEALDKAFGNKAKFIALCLDVPDEVIVQRASGRFICKQCGTIYNKELAPPKKPGICDKCGGEVYQRPDDSTKVVQERLKVYHALTAPLIQYYENKKVLTHINGNQSPDIVFNALKLTIQASLDKF